MDLGRNLKLDLVVQQLPPAADAIGSYTALLASALSVEANVRIFTSSDAPIDAIANVDVFQCFSVSRLNRFDELRCKLINTDAHVVILQYNPFAWGRRGWAPDLVKSIELLRIRRPELTIAVMFHETYMMNSGIRAWIMRLYQRRQYNSLVRLADVCFFSIQAWAEEERHRNVAARVVHLPVGSNLPLSHQDPAVTRRRWNIHNEAQVFGIFGGLHITRRLAWVGRIVSRLSQMFEGETVTLLCVGGQIQEILNALNVHATPPNLSIICTGHLPASEAADAIAAMDLLLSPFSDGISSRRGSAIAAVQHGVPVASTRGCLTDDLWLDKRGCGIFLSPADDEIAWSDMVTQLAKDGIDRDNVAAAAKAFYTEHFSWPSIAKTLLDALVDSKQLGSFHLDPVHL